MYTFDWPFSATLHTHTRTTCAFLFGFLRERVWGQLRVALLILQGERERECKCIVESWSVYV